MRTNFVDQVLPGKHFVLFRSIDSHFKFTWFVRLSILTVLTTVVLLLVAKASAQEDLLSAVTTEAEYAFGQNMRFSVEADSEVPVNKVTLFLQAPDLPQTMSIDLDVDPDTELEAEYEVDLTELQLSPFTTVTYWWHLQDAEGNETTTPEKTLDYVDDRFEWRALEGQTGTVYWTGDDPAIGHAALDALNEALPQLQAIIPGGLPTLLRIYVYPSLSDLQAGMRLTGREWVSAQAHPQLGVILVAAANPKTAAAELAHDIPHELSHLMVFQATGVGYEGIPLWFDEGLATVLEPAPNGSFDTIIQEAVGAGDTIPLANMCQSFPEGQEPLAYAESASIVDYIRTEYGIQAITNMLRAVADGADCETMIERGLGLSSLDLHEEWLAQQGNHSPVARIWRRGGAYIIVLVAGLVIMTYIILYRPKASS